MNKFYELSCRSEVPIYTKYKPTPDFGANVVNYKKEKLYNYYKCDYCGSEIKITKKWQDMTGGITIIPRTVTRRGAIKLALCNKCLNPVIKEFEEERKENHENEIVKGKMQGIARKVEEELPKNWGFVVLAFEFGDSDGREMLYVSNANREDVVKAMEEFAQKTKSNYGNDTGKYGRSENK